MLLHNAMICLLLQCGSEKWEVRNRASERLLKCGYVGCLYAMKGVGSEDPEIRARCARVVDVYRSVNTPLKANLHYVGILWSSDAWHKLYQRATGKSYDIESQRYNMSASDEDEIRMKELWVQDLFSRGYPRWWVRYLVWEANQNWY